MAQWRYRGASVDRSADERAPDDPRDRLTSKELAVLQLAARGYTPVQIAALLEVRVAEAVGHLRRAAAALGVDTAPAAVAEAQRRGLID